MQVVKKSKLLKNEIYSKIRVKMILIFSISTDSTTTEVLIG